ncbi:hypothetical protein [Curvivirga sp.]|uniref:hypothetical protein n=1 Tax=Curvivirga sp. TaxID=2856848 RepID=UPI003B5BEBE3
MNADMIVFGEDWGSHPSSTQHLIHHLSKNRRVFWINSIGMRRPQINFRDFNRLFAKGRAIFRKQTVEDKVDGPVDVVAPKVFPWPGNRVATRLNQSLLLGQLYKVLGSHNCSDPIVWTSLPTAVDYLDGLKKKALIYYCGDDFGALDGVDHAPVLECEKRLGEAADLIITVSQKLADKFPAEKTILIPHGVDYGLFSSPVEPAPECQTKRPIAGFYGSLAEWIDVDLIAETAKKLPNWDFMFIGPIKTDISAFRNLKNIQLIDAMPHAQLPSYVQHWQAALLPFKDNEQIRSCNPLKLREYIASNTPVVTTCYPAMEPYRDVVNVFETSDDLVSVLRNIKPSDDQSLRVKNESWGSKAGKLDNILRQWNN